jgi:hypothetical protein
MRTRVRLTIDELVLHGFAHDEAPRVAAALAAALEERLAAAPFAVPADAERLRAAPVTLPRGGGGRASGAAVGRAVADALAGGGGKK